MNGSAAVIGQVPQRALWPKPLAQASERKELCPAFSTLPPSTPRLASHIELVRVLAVLEDGDLVGGGQDALSQEAAAQQRVDERRLACSGARMQGR